MARKGFEPEDPMTLIGSSIPCDEKAFDEMIDAIIEEYMLTGWSDENILRLFTSKFFQLTHAAAQKKGENYVRERIRMIRTMWSPREKQ